MKSKILVIILICIFLIFTITNVNYAVLPEGAGAGGTTDMGGDKGLINPDEYKPNDMTTVTDADHLFEMGNTVIGVVRTVGSILSVIVLAVIGIKYMLGSVEERADYKTSMGPYIWGAVLVFGITNILAIIMDVISSFNS